MASERKKRLGDHERCQELVALYSTGVLADDEVEFLACHLRDCQPCRAGLSEYRTLFRQLGQFFNSELLAPTASESPWAPSLKREVLQKCFVQRPAISRPLTAGDKATGHETVILPIFSSLSMHRLAFSFLLLLLIGGAALFLRRDVGIKNLRYLPTNSEAKQRSEMLSRTELEAAAAERDSLKSQLADQSAIAVHFKQRVSQQQAEIEELKARLGRLEIERGKAVAERDETQVANSLLRRDQLDVTHHLQETEASLTQTEQKLRDSQGQHTVDLLEETRLQAQVAHLNSELHSRDATIQQQEQLLASDRDIRDLMGARELTIADISDFDLNAQKKKPFGRVFFTKNKSLIFYAFDLDEKRGLRKASAFQAWGVSDSDRKTAVNLGILYKDSESNRRWILKFEDPEILERIDAIFVTVEPNGGSLKPSGKQLLYAYIRTQPNHP